MHPSFHTGKSDIRLSDSSLCPYAQTARWTARRIFHTCGSEKPRLLSIPHGAQSFNAIACGTIRFNAHALNRKATGMVFPCAKLRLSVSLTPRRLKRRSKFIVDFCASVSGWKCSMRLWRLRLYREYKMENTAQEACLKLTSPVKKRMIIASENHKGGIAQWLGFRFTANRPASE